MVKINLAKYGFVRVPEGDFSDDGNYFKMYSLDGVRFSYLRSDGRIYLSGRGEEISGIHDGLIYEEYSHLPDYRSLDDLNGIDVSDLIEEDIYELVAATRRYIEQYKKALMETQFVDKLEVRNKLIEVAHKKQNEYTNFIHKFNQAGAKILKLEDYALKDLKHAYTQLKNESNYNVDSRFDRITRTEKDMRYFLKRGFYSEMEPSYYYKSAMRYFEKVVD